jgi:hypothetical protein
MVEGAAWGAAMEMEGAAARVWERERGAKSLRAER